MTNQDKFDRAVGEATCFMLGSVAGGATQLAVYSLITGNFVVGGGAALVGAISAYAYANDCSWDPNKPPDIPGVNCNTTWERTTPSDGFIAPFGESWPTFPQLTNVQKIVSSEPLDDITWVVQYVSAADGNTYSFNFNYSGFSAVCVDLQGSGDPVTPSPPTPPTVPPYTYTDPGDGCQIIVNFLGWGQDPAGNVGAAWSLEPATTGLASTRATGGCNFNKIVRFERPGGGGGGGGQWYPVYIPWNTDRPWSDIIKDMLPWLAFDVAKQLIELTADNYPETEYEILAPCEKDAQGNPASYRTFIPEDTFNWAVLRRLDSIASMFSPQLNFKVKTCSSTPAPLTGDPVSINWVSDEYSPNGNNRIRKLLTYFDQKNTSLADTVAHWKDFTWDAGSVIVSVNGVSLGRPQVWAATAEEGKRVINHAAAIAGVDMTNAEWLITTPRASRYGQTGKMRVHRGANGALGITKRDGPNGLPPALS